MRQHSSGHIVGEGEWKKEKKEIDALWIQELPVFLERSAVAGCGRELFYIQWFPDEEGSYRFDFSNNTAFWEMNSLGGETESLFFSFPFLPTSLFLIKNNSLVCFPSYLFGHFMSYYRECAMSWKTQSLETELSGAWSKWIPCSSERLAQQQDSSLWVKEGV